MQAFEVEQQGCRLAATVSGSGPPVVFIQGVGLHGDGWLPQVSWLDRAYACMRFDNRGIGKSQPLGARLSVERMAEDVRALMDAAGWDDAHVVGHSLGALVALELALGSPRRVRSLALLCATAAGRDLVRLSWWSLWVGLRMKVGPQPRRRRAYSAAERLDALPDVPMIVVTCSEDRVARPEHGAALARRLRHAHHVELSGAAHGLTIHRADEVNDLLEQHLAAAEEDRGRPAATLGA